MLYDKLEKVNTGINYEFVDQFLGRPHIARKLGFEEFLERIYIHKKYIVRLVLDREGIIVFYSVTTRTSGFKPKVPLELYHGDAKGRSIPYLTGLRLGEFKFSDLPHNPERVHFFDWSKGLYYTESHFFGNPGLYKDYLFELTTTGCCVDDQDVNSVDWSVLRKEIARTKIDLPATSNVIMRYRYPLYPNSFGLFKGSRTGNSEGLLDFLMERSISAKQYEVIEFR